MSGGAGCSVSAARLNPSPDAGSDRRLDIITDMAVRLLGVELAFILMKSGDQMSLAAMTGTLQPGCDTGTIAAFCTLLAGAPETPLMVCDTRSNTGCAGDPSVALPPHIRCYAAVPVDCGDSLVCATLCILGTRPRRAARADLRTLQHLAGSAASLLDPGHHPGNDFASFDDGLTGLASRRQLRRLLDAYGAAPAAERNGAVLCVDLDRFSAVNAARGRGAGDAVLRLGARRLAACSRPGDVLARIGGDSFAFFRPVCPSPDLEALCGDLLATFAEPFWIDGQGITIGASIGVAVAPRDGTDGEQLLGNAGLALARAKADGGGVWRGFTRGMDEAHRQRQALRIDLHEALRNGEFRLLYQPLMGLQSGRVEGFEALLRWHHPTRGDIPPADFIAVAEENGLIVAIGAWVLRQACREAMGWPSGLPISVNLSALQFTPSRELLWTVAVALSQVGLAPRRLELEITETLPLLDNDANLAVLRQLRALGVRIVLDDFGTGYASIGTLQRFAFDKLKIDRSIVQRADADAKGRAILRAVIGMGRALNIRITAEGVETHRQLAALRADGCDQVQGFVFSPAICPEDIPALIEALERPLTR